jgi:hypothetical protein
MIRMHLADWVIFWTVYMGTALSDKKKNVHVPWKMFHILLPTLQSINKSQTALF